MTARDAGIYSIGAVAKMLGVSVQTLRAWEDRYKQVVPSRSPGGHRLYSRDDIEQLRFILERTEAGLQAADAHRLLAEQGHARADPGAGGSRSGQPGADPERFAVLVAERDPFAAEFADYFLRTEGYAVHVVLDVAEAEQTLDSSTPQVVVIDLMISGGAGLGLCRAVRARGAIPVLAVSPVDCRDAAVDAGADAFLPKPVEPLQFVSAVRDLLGTSGYLRSDGASR
ncbi:MAG TPA: MerR family transcriptional regulator [Jatrophihabitantaceae bacterium]